MARNRKKTGKRKKQGNYSLKPVLTAAVCMIIFKILLIPVTTWKGFGYLLLPFSLYLVWFALWQAVIPGIVSGKAGVKLRMGKVSALQRMAVQWLLLSVAAGGVAAFLLSKVTTEIMAVSGNSLVRLGLSVLPLTAWVMAPLGVLRGLISGTGYGRIAAVSLVSEQLLAGGIGILAARLLFQSGEKASLVYGNPDYPAAFAAKGSMLGMGAGALVSLCFMIVFYRSSWKDTRRRALRNRMKNKKQ